MEESKEEKKLALDLKAKNPPPLVTVERGWKDYLGECFLIVFSVILALILTEFINHLNEKNRTDEILHQLKEELTDNKKLEEEQYAYHLNVLKKIDSSISNQTFASQLISNGELHLDLIAPNGVLLHDLNDVAWQIAKANNIVSKIDITTYYLLNNIYTNQQRITASEEKIAQLLLSQESRKPENLRTTLVLLHDNYHGWDVDRAPALINSYQQAMNALSNY